MERSAVAVTEPDGAAGGAASPRALTVAQIVARIRGAVEGQFPAPVWVEGELSNCSYPASGHIYFSLVDEQVTDRFGQRLLLPCAFFRNANQHVRFRLADGLKVLCFGQVTVYEGKGQYQLRVLRVEPKGIGALQLAFEQLKKRLGAEGLFETSRKRPIPRVPSRVGLVTSPAGSAIHDMVSKLRDRFHVVVLPARVQGEGASADIAEAIELANRLRLADVLIVGRGGGSLEDLWAFNEERVARAIGRSRIPVISAVGHQDDWTIADYVADLRASTPTDAAKLLVHEQEAFADAVAECVRTLREAMTGILEDEGRRLDTLQAQLRLLHPMALLERHRSRAEELHAHLLQSMRHALATSTERLRALAGRLEALSPLDVLARGYSITFVRRAGARHVITRSSLAAPGDELETLLARGRLVSAVSSVLPEEPPEDHGRAR